MDKWNLHIELRSDFCTATGESAPGMINTKTALEYGVPYIPAKRIKGCLLEAGREMADNGLIAADMLPRLFGRAGMGQGEGVRFRDGHISAVPGYLFDQTQEERIPIEDYERFQKNLRDSQNIEPSLPERIFTRNRTRTALEEETGTAKKHSLRTMQVVPHGVVFSSLIEGKLEEEEEEALRLCVKGLRHMGMGITRGLGEIRCTLQKAGRDEPQTGKTFTLESAPEDEITLLYEIELESPVVLPEESAGSSDQIPASAVLGALAGMYIKKHDLALSAHENADFRRIFLRDGVQFGNAFLKKADMEFVPCPKALALPKEDKTAWFNVMKGESTQRRKSISGQIAFRKEGVYIETPKTEIHFHHARPADRAIGHALNDRAEDRSRPTGQFFQYIALSKGQTFAGTWKGKAKDIQELLACLEKHQFRLMLGRSRTAEYGRCVFRPLREYKDSQKDPSIKGTEWLVWLLSPMVYPDQEKAAHDSNKSPLANQMREKLGQDCKIVDSMCSYTVLKGYNSRWKLPAAPCLALAEGSTFYINTGKEVADWEISGRRWGMLTGKGCGQVMAVPWGQAFGGKVRSVSGGKVLSVPEPDAEDIRETDPLTDRILAVQKQRQNCENAVSSAFEKLNEQKESLPSSSDISMLIQLLKHTSGSQKIYKHIKEEAERISKGDKRERVLQFIAPCEKESFEFIKQYLTAAKWKARKKEEA